MCIGPQTQGPQTPSPWAPRPQAHGPSSVHPSGLGDGEAGDLPLLPAVAAHKQVLANQTQLEGFPELLRHGQGLQAHPGAGVQHQDHLAVLVREQEDASLRGEDDSPGAQRPAAPRRPRQPPQLLRAVLKPHRHADARVTLRFGEHQRIVGFWDKAQPVELTVLHRELSPSLLKLKLRAVKLYNLLIAHAHPDPPRVPRAQDPGARLALVRQGHHERIETDQLYILTVVVIACDGQHLVALHAEPQHPPPLVLERQPRRVEPVLTRILLLPGRPHLALWWQGADAEGGLLLLAGDGPLAARQHGEPVYAFTARIARRDQAQVQVLWSGENTHVHQDNSLNKTRSSARGNYSAKSFAGDFADSSLSSLSSALGDGFRGRGVWGQGG